MTRTLRNLAVRIVGTYLRVNLPAGPVITLPARYKPTIDMPELPEVAVGTAGHPTVATAMDALVRALPRAGYDLRLTDLPETRLLDSVTFGPTGSTEPFHLSAYAVTGRLSECQAYCPSGRRLIASWQYTLHTAPGGPAVPITGRPSYHDSPPVTDGMAITWRMNITHASAMSAALRARRA